MNSQYIDTQKTRRKIEEYLRKFASPDILLDVAHKLGVEPEYILIPEVEEFEWKAVEIIDSGKELSEDTKALIALLPEKYPVFYAGLIDPGDRKREIIRYSDNCLTRAMAEKILHQIHIAGVEQPTIAEEKVNILKIRSLAEDRIKETSSFYKEEQGILEVLRKAVFRENQKVS